MDQLATATVTVRSRAQAIRDMVEIRLASNAMGPVIADILKENGIELLGAKWDNVSPHWLIATVDDEVIGCLQLIVSKPVGYLEFLYVRKAAPFKLKAIAIRKLMIQGMGTLTLAGCQYVGSAISKRNQKFADVIEKLNVTKLQPGDMYLKRLS